MNFQQLSTFCVVLSEGSMTAAAEKLGRTQPAISQQIRSLEAEMDVPLLLRGVRQVKPTMQGQLLFDYAKRILHLTQQAEVAMKTISQDLKGHLRVGTVNSIGMFLISPVVGLFLKHNSQLNLELTYQSFKKTQEDLLKQELDIAILPRVKGSVFFNKSDLKEQFLFKDEVWLVGSGKDASIPDPIALEDLVRKPTVTLSGIYPDFQTQFAAELQKQELTCKPVFKTDNVGTLKRVIESGLGWGFLPAHSIRKQVRTRRLKRIHVPDLEFSIDLCLYSRKDKYISQAADVFFRAIQQQALN